MYNERRISVYLHLASGIQMPITARVSLGQMNDLLNHIEDAVLNEGPINVDVNNTKIRIAPGAAIALTYEIENLN